MDILGKAREIEERIIEDHRQLHKIPEVGFDLPRTSAYVKKRLGEIGVEYEDCGRSGVIAYIGDRKAKGCILLRADMDALPIKEETSLEYKAENGAMHACGHDAHTAMLLGAASLLKDSVSAVTGCVKLLFQPAEEILEGAKDMIENGALSDPKVDAAVMLHCIVGTELESGSVIVSSAGVSAPAVSYFKITVKGKGCHGSTPDKGRDPIIPMCRIITSLDTVRARELPATELAVITVGRVSAGASANVIPDIAEAEGSIRAYSNETVEYLKNRLESLVSAMSGAFESESAVDFYSSAPSLLNDEMISEAAYSTLSETLKGVTVTTSDEIKKAESNGKGSIGAGSEDFAYISRMVPSVMIGIAAGKKSEGYDRPLHHPAMRIDEKALAYGAAAYAAVALRLGKYPKNRLKNR